MVAMYPPDEFEARNEGISLRGYRRQFSTRLNLPEKDIRSIHRVSRTPSFEGSVWKMSLCDYKLLEALPYIDQESVS